MKETFRKLANRASKVSGSPGAFFAALSIVVIWACFGPYYKWSANHSLFINSITTIITFLTVFLIQSSQNHDTRVIQTKLNAILAALEGASNQLIDLESEAEAELDKAVEEIKAIKDS